MDKKNENRKSTFLFACALCACFSSACGDEPPKEIGVDPAELDASLDSESSMSAQTVAPSTPLLDDGKTFEREVRDLKRFDFASLDDEPDALKRLDATAPIWVSKDRSRVLLGGEICLREGELEFFACRRNSKEHESIVALDVPPHLIHAALLVIGVKQGAPAKFNPVFEPPRGDVVEIEARWRDAKSGALIKRRAQEMILENESERTMRSNWVFAGGLFGVDPDGKKYYLANVTGEVFGVSNFPGAVLDVPFESPSDYSNLYYQANTEAIPEIGAPVLLVLRRGEAKTIVKADTKSK